mmetsp:Transcript_43777/g.88261  ORF Transcript_43777/g.88261 Transcript_43777/m.88261 type:complete len:232 (+) Transcript_43777:429-1124(+)
MLHAFREGGPLGFCVWGLKEGHEVQEDEVVIANSQSQQPADDHPERGPIRIRMITRRPAMRHGEAHATPPVVAEGLRRAVLAPRKTCRCFSRQATQEAEPHKANVPRFDALLECCLSPKALLCICHGKLFPLLDSDSKVLSAVQEGRHSEKVVEYSSHRPLVLRPQICTGAEHERDHELEEAPSPVFVGCGIRRHADGLSGPRYFDLDRRQILHGVGDAVHHHDLAQVRGV